MIKKDWKILSKKVITLYDLRIEKKKSKAKIIFAWKLGAHPQSLNIILWPIVNKYREGKVKRTLFKGVKKKPEIQYLQSIEAYKI